VVHACRKKARPSRSRFFLFIPDEGVFCTPSLRGTKQSSHTRVETVSCLPVAGCKKPPRVKYRYIYVGTGKAGVRGRCPAGSGRRAGLWAGLQVWRGWCSVLLFGK
jgi:hypothetical protein